MFHFKIVGKYSFTVKILVSMLILAGCAMVVFDSGEDASGAADPAFEVDGVTYTPLTDDTVGVGKSISNIYFAAVKSDFSGNLTIPSTVSNGVKDFTVTQLLNNAFFKIKGLSSIEIPSTVKCIWFNAFSGCTGLTSVTMPSSIEEIKGSAFYGCSSLDNVILPPGIKALNAKVFYGCASLTSITIPKLVTTISNDAFSGCEKLAGISVDPENSMFDSVDGMLHTKDRTTLLICAPGKSGSLSIVDGTSKIGVSAFSGCTKITSLVLPDSVMTIGNGAFVGCTAMSSLSIGSGVSSINGGLFSGCTSLVDITVAEGNSVLSSSGGLVMDRGEKTVFLCVPGYAGSMTIPASVESIIKYAFLNCAGLSSVTVPSSVKTMGGGIFVGCTGLTSVVLEEGLQAIGVNMFDGCTGLTKVTIPSSVRNIPRAFGNCSSLSEIVLKEGTESIEKEAFKDCTALTKIDIPSSVLSLGDDAFNGCTSLESVTIPASVALIGDSVFSCTGLTSVVLEEGLQAIGTNMFASCTSLESVTIPASVALIGNSAFSCTGLTTLSVPSTVRTFENGVFSGCTALTSATLEEGLSTVGDGMFSGCTALTSVAIPSSVTVLSKDVFNGCTSLESVTIPSSVEEIRDSAFRGCSGLVSVGMSNGLTIIGNSVFRDCISLSSAVLPSTVISIGATAFFKCSSLGSVSIPSAVTKIENNTFKGCTSLSDVFIPSLVNSIGKNAFSGCAGLTSISIPNSLEAIGTGAFDGISFVREDGSTPINPNSELDEFKGHVYKKVEGSMRMCSAETHVLFIEYFGAPSALPVHAEVVNRGATYSVSSPVVEGYLPDKLKVEGTADPASLYTYVEVYFAKAFTITWKIDGESDTVQVRLGSMPVHADPAKAPTAEFSYTFSGWDPQPVAVTGDATYTAMFDETVNKYSVTWKSGDEVLATDEVEYSAVPVYGGSTPTRASDDRYSYSFIGWDGNISVPIEGDKTFSALFRAVALPSSADKDYHFYLYSSVGGSDQTVNGWIVGQGTTVMAAFTDALLDNGIGFTGFDAASDEVFFNGSRYFSDWMPGDWKNDGNLYEPNMAIWNYNEVDGWHRGNTFGRDADAVYLISYERHVAALGPTAISLGAVITGPDPAPYGLVYDGITGGYAGLYEAVMAYLPLAEQALYTDLDGSAYGLSYDAVADTEGCGGFDMAFIMWAVGLTRDYSGVAVGYDTGNVQLGYMQMAPADKDAAPEYLVFGDMAEAVGNYDGTPARFYTVKWVDGNGAVVETDSGVKYGAEPIYDGETPAKASTIEFSYTFDGWSPAVASVTGDVTYTSLFVATVIGYAAGDNPVVVLGADAGTVSPTAVAKAKTDAQNGAIQSLSFATSNGTVTMDSAAIVSLSASGEVTVSVTKDPSLSAAAKAAVGDRPVFRVEMGDLHQFGSGKLSVSLPYVLSGGESAGGVYVCWVKADGTLERIPTAYSADKGEVSFETPHLSDFAIMYSEEGGSDSSILLICAVIVAIVLVVVASSILGRRAV